MAETEEAQKNLGAIRTDIEQPCAVGAAATAPFRTFVEDHFEEMAGAAVGAQALVQRRSDLKNGQVSYEEEIEK